MELYIVRHGESKGNELKLCDDNSLKNKDKDKNCLSEKGKEQARELAKELEKYKFDVLILSPLLRTRETMAPYLEKNKIKTIVSDLTIERDMGVFSNKPWSVLKEYREKNNIPLEEYYAFRPEGGESMVEVYGRAEKFLEYLKKNFKNKNVLVCGHSGFLRCLNIKLKGLNIKDFYSSEEIKNCEIKKYTI